MFVYGTFHKQFNVLYVLHLQLPYVHKKCGQLVSNSILKIALRLL